MKKRRDELLQELESAMIEEETRVDADPESSQALLESLDLHFSDPNVPADLIQIRLPSVSRSSPAGVTEIYVEDNNLQAPLPAPPLMTTEVHDIDNDDLGKTTAKIEAIRKEYESKRSCLFCFVW